MGFNMGRKPDPKGKDRPRTIVLSGDVAEIAQRLAGKNVLSFTLSELLRKEFGVHTALEKAKADLKELIEEREANAAAQEALIAQIDSMETAAMTKRETMLPGIEMRLEKLYARRERVQRELERCFTPNEQAMKRTVLINIAEIIAKTEEEKRAVMGE